MLFGYTLNIPTLGGPISAKKERQKFRPNQPIGLPGVLTKEDQTAPYQTAPKTFHRGLKLYYLSMPWVRSQGGAGALQYIAGECTHRRWRFEQGRSERMTVISHAAREGCAARHRKFNRHDLSDRFVNR